MQINVAIIYGGFLDFGGVETHLLSLFQRGDSARFRWVIFASTSQEFCQRANKYGVQVVPCRIAYAVDIKAILLLVRLFKTYKIALLHIHDPRAFIVGQIAASLLGLKTIYTVHIPFYDYVLENKLFFKLKRYLYLQFSKRVIYNFAHHLSFVSKKVYEETITKRLSFAHKMSLIPNGVDLEKFNPPYNKDLTREQLHLPLSTPIICFVGRLEMQKGVDTLLDAVTLLANAQNDFMVWIVGDGAERDFLQRKAEIACLESKLSFLGFRDDICEILNSANIFVLPSRYEGMPLAILEAMAAGLPVITTDVGDNSLLVEDGVTGFIVHPNAPVALAEKLQILINNSSLEKSMGMSAKQKILLFSDAMMVSKIETMYTSLLPFKEH